MPRRGRPSKTIPASAPKLDEEKTPSVDKSIAEPESKVLSSLEKLKQDTDILLMLYPKNEDGYFTESIESQDEITVYNLIKEKKDFKDKLFILLDTSGGTGSAFAKLKVKVRPEIVTTGIPNKDFGPLKQVTGKYLSAEKLKKWYEENKEFYVVDMRNDYEFEIGRFQNSVWPKGLGHFRDVPKAIKTIENLKDKTVVTVCTGGVRCETASGLLLKYGFKDVYQLENGIVTFMEKYPNTYFQGKLLVFDGRETMGFNLDSKEYKSVGACRNCGKPSENLVNYWVTKDEDAYGIICKDCISSGAIKLAR
jgi:predicted sulfurtransferase